MAHKQKKKFKIIEMDNLRVGKHDFIRDESDFQQTFVTIVHDDPKRGVYYGNNRKSYVFLKNHENQPDIINTCTHETLHGAIDRVSTMEDEESAEGSLKEADAFFLDDRIEHIIIRYMLWADEFIIKDFDPSYNQALREELEK
jgi:hypothetical protein